MKSRELTNYVSTSRRRLISNEVFLVLFGFLVASFLRFDLDFWQVLLLYPGFPFVFSYPFFWYLLLEWTHSWDRGLMGRPSEYYSRVFQVAIWSLILFSAFAFLAKYPISRIWIIINTILITVFLILHRYFLRHIYLKSLPSVNDRVFVIISKEVDRTSVLNFFERDFGFSPNYIWLEAPLKEEEDDWFNKYADILENNDVFGVVMALDAIGDSEILHKLADFKRECFVDLLIDTRVSFIATRFESKDSLRLVYIRESEFHNNGSFMKRLFDITFSSLSLLILSPLLLLISIMIKLTSKGPVLYIDERVSKKGEFFRFPKFRTMIVKADSLRQEVLGHSDLEIMQNYRQDSRVTSFGLFLRRWSLDELPQLWLILIGEMSVVGPRPILREELEKIPKTFEKRFLAKPGLTGLWQVSGRKEVSWEERMELDISYIENWSLSYDLYLIGKTVVAVLRGIGSY